MKELTIVTLTPDTRIRLANVAVGVFDNAISEGHLDAFLNSEHEFMELAVVDDQVVGMASYVLYHHPDKPRSMWINEIGVGDAHLRQGFGRALVDRVLQRAKEHGCSEVWLGTEAENTAANALYKSVPDTLSEDVIVYTFTI